MSTQSLYDMTNIRQKFPASSKLVFVHGNFNVLHAGHVRLFQFARECGDVLIVGVYSNAVAGGTALVDEALRLEAVKSNSWVNHAFLMQQSAEDVISELKPAVVVKGKEHENRWNAESKVVQSYGGMLQFCSGDMAFSASSLLKQELACASRLFRVNTPEDYLGRHKISLQKVDSLLQNADRVSIGVIGDVIVDEYVTCDPLGMSQEDPTIVVTPVGTDRFLGGAAIVAAHCAGLGARVNYFSVTGNDALRDYVKSKADEYGIAAHLVVDETRPTTLKQRYRACGKTLLRVNHLRQHAIHRDLQNKLLKKVCDLLPSMNVLVFSDFNYGCLPQPLVDEIISSAKELGVFIIADSQCSSQIGDVSRFKGVDILTPTEMEARVSTRNHEDGLVVLAEKLRMQAGAQNVLLKLGAEGVLVHSMSEQNEWHTDQLPALNRQPVDTAGAGDSLLAAAAVGIALGGSIWEVALLGMIAASLQVSRIGNIPLTSSQLVQAIRQ